VDRDGNGMAVRVRSRGATAGFDRPWGQRGTYGFMGGVSGNRVEAGSRQRVNVDSYRVGAYANRIFGNDWYGTGILSYGNFDLRSSRSIDFAGLSRIAGARFDADGFAGYLEAGKILRYGDVIIRPHATLQLTSVDQDSFSESGADSLNLNVNAIDDDSLLAGVGVWVSRTFHSDHGTLVTPELRLRYLVELEDLRTTAVASVAGAPGSPFAATTARGSDSFLLAGLGLTASVSDSLAFFGSYDGQFSNSSDTLSVEFGARVAW
jgi:outer membrane autotransporter protein